MNDAAKLQRFYGKTKKKDGNPQNVCNKIQRLSKIESTDCRNINPKIVGNRLNLAVTWGQKQL